jgi:hypothetical protein
MNIREISDIFKDTADNITAIKSYNFGWASDRVRQGNTEDFQELNEFPRVFFSVPTITGSDQTRKQDTYQVTIFFDDLLGYDNEGDEDPTLQIDKWANLQQYANYFVQRLNKIKQSILPNYLFIPEAPSITFDSFTGLQRMITVQLSFNLVVPTNCDPGIITLVQCIANIVTSSNLTASLTTVLKFAASLEGRATVTADINFVQKVASNLNANALLGGDISFVQKAQANLSALASLTGDISFVQKAQASLLTSASVTGNITIPKTFNASLLATGTTTADLTVQAAASLLLDLYPNAAAAYSLRKLRTAYTGSAVRVRASISGAEGDVSFDVNSTISASSTVTVTAVGTSGLSIGQQVTFSTFWNAGGSNQNVFVTTWYDQSGNANNATQTTQASQPQIVSSGNLILRFGKPYIEATSAMFLNLTPILVNTNDNYSFWMTYEKNIDSNTAVLLNTQTSYLWLDYRTQQYVLGNDFISISNLFQINTMYLNNMNINYLVGVNQYRNNILLGTRGALTTSGGFSKLPSNQYRSLKITFNELIFYSFNQDTNRIGITNNINSFYGIY